MNDPTHERHNVMYPIALSIQKIGIERAFGTLNHSSMMEVSKKYWQELSIAFAINGSEEHIYSHFVKLYKSDIDETQADEEVASLKADAWRPTSGETYFSLSRQIALAKLVFKGTFTINISKPQLRRDIVYYLARGDFVDAYRAMTVFSHKMVDLGTEYQPHDNNVANYMSRQLSLISDSQLIWEGLIYRKLKGF